MSNGLEKTDDFLKFFFSVYYLPIYFLIDE